MMLLTDREQYFAHPAYGSNALKTILDSPLDFKYLYIDCAGERIETQAMALGTALHTWFLEPELFDSLYLVADPSWGPLNKAPWNKLWADLKKRALDEGKSAITHDKAAEILKLSYSAKANAAITDLIKRQAATELSVFSNYDGIDIKARIDLLTDDRIIWDVKTTSRGITDDQIRRTIEDEGYHFQAAHYLQCAEKTIEPTGYGWIFIDTSKRGYPYLRAVRADDKYLEIGKSDFDTAIQILKTCRENDLWPGKCDGTIQTLGPSEWFIKSYYK